MSELSSFISGIYKKAAVENLGRNAAIGAGLGALGGGLRYHMMDEKKKRRSSLLNHLVGGGALGAAGGGAVSALPSLEGVLSTGAGDKKPGWVGSTVSGVGQGILGAVGLDALTKKYNPNVMKTMGDRVKDLIGAKSTEKLPGWNSMVEALGGAKHLATSGAGGASLANTITPENFMGELQKADKATQRSVSEIFRRNAPKGSITRAGMGRQVGGLLASGAGRYLGGRDTLAGNAWRGGADALTGYQVAKMMGRSGGKGALLGPLLGLLADKGTDYARGAIDNQFNGSPFESWGFGE